MKINGSYTNNAQTRPQKVKVFNQKEKQQNNRILYILLHKFEKYFTY